MSQLITRKKALSLFAGIVGIFIIKRLFGTEIKSDTDIGNTLAADSLTDGSSISATTGATVITDSLTVGSSSYTTSKVLLILKSFHHENTVKIANAMASVLKAEIKSPDQINVNDLQSYDLIGFGSGIYDEKHHKAVLDLVDKLPNDAQMKVFIYSTSGFSREKCLKHSFGDPHKVITEKLLLKKCNIIDEFNCAGWDTMSFLKLFGGINKGKPDAEDLNHAKEFALNLSC